MDGGDLHRSLLTVASRAQQQRHVQLHNGSGGNVFLPSIQKKRSVQLALSMKHLEVIEQCILAENRREEQLAKCPSEQERRYLTKKFIAQRDHERDLLQALMLGHPADHELQIVDVNLEPHRSPLGSLFPSRARQSNRDKVIQMHGDKIFATTTASNQPLTKGVSPHFHSVKSPAPQSAESVEQGRNVSLSKTTAMPTSPMRERPTKSVSVTPTVASLSPHKRERSELPHGLAGSPLRPSNRNILSTAHTTTTTLPTPSTSPSPSPTKRKKEPKAERTTLERSFPSTPGYDEKGCDDSEGLAVVASEDATTFEEARQFAVRAVVPDRIDVVEEATQTTDRTDGLRNEQLQRRREQFEPLLAKEPIILVEEMAPSKTPSRCRPHSSPEQRPRRRRSGEAHALPALAHSKSHTIVSKKETVEYKSAEKRPEQQAFPQDAEDGEDVNTTVILDMINGLVHKIKEMNGPSTLPARVFEERVITIELGPVTPRTTIVNFGRFVTRIQSAFRGYCTRREFRVALYQQALKCGVLGAMPGTLQGRTGWYQDPKSFMAYYFTVRPDGEWVQKAVLRCSALVLTPYQMREQISTRTPSDLLVDSEVR